MATIINTRLKEQRQERLKKHKGASVKKINKTQRKAKSNDSIGNIHFVHPSHVVDKKEIKQYLNKKGNSNYRPVAIVKKNKNNEVVVSQIYGNRGKSKNFPRSKLITTKMKKQSYIDTAELDKSFKSNKKFSKDESPLNRKRDGKVSRSDLKRREKLKKQKKPHK